MENKFIAFTRTRYETGEMWKEIVNISQICHVKEHRIEEKDNNHGRRKGYDIYFADGHAMWIDNKEFEELLARCGLIPYMYGE